MNLNSMIYPEVFTIGGTDYKGRRNSIENKVLIPLHRRATYKYR